MLIIFFNNVFFGALLLFLLRCVEVSLRSVVYVSSLYSSVPFGHLIRYDPFGCSEVLCFSLTSLSIGLSPRYQSLCPSVVHEP